MLPHLDYCNSLLVGLPQYLIKRLQGVHQYLELPDVSTSHHSCRTFTGYLSIGEPYTRLLHYVILHYLALILNTYLTLLMFTPLIDPCALPRNLVS